MSLKSWIQANQAASASLATQIASISGSSFLGTASYAGTASFANSLTTARHINGVLFDGTYGIGVDKAIAQLNFMGSVAVGVDLINPIPTSTTGIAPTNQTVYFMPSYVTAESYLSGVKWFQTATGSYTPNNYNGVGLYSFGAGELTLITSSVNDSDIWIGSTGSIYSKSWTPTLVVPGLYYIAFLYCNSAQVISPSILKAGPDIYQYANKLDYSADTKMYASTASQTALPSFVLMSDLADGYTNNFWFMLW